MDGANASDVNVARRDIVCIGVMVWVYWDFSVSGTADATLDDEATAGTVYCSDDIDSAA